MNSLYTLTHLLPVISCEIDTCFEDEEIETGKLREHSFIEILPDSKGSVIKNKGILPTE